MIDRLVNSSGDVYAIHVAMQHIQDGTEWFGEPFEPLQISRMKYPKGKTFRKHKHIMNPRIIKRTQEAFIVVAGIVAVDIEDESKKPMGTLYAKSGEAILVYRGYHAVRVLEDFVGYEVKAGQYSYVSEDKVDA